MQNHTKSLNLGIEPKGPPEMEKTEESASHHVYIFYFAQLRAENLDIMQKTLKISPETKIRTAVVIARSSMFGDIGRFLKDFSL